jgi:transcriptional regulator with XRE-family HTH domain
MDVELNFVAIGNRIRKQREFLGYTRDYVAEKVSVSTNFCRDIEIGAKGMSISTLAKLSAVLKISSDYILFGRSKSDSFNRVSLMLESFPPEKQKYAEELLKIFLLALDEN